MSIRSLGSSQRLMAKLAAMLEAGQYYEAHQLYRTLYFRLTNANKLNELSQLLYEGAITFLKRNQFNSGSDLACLYLDVILKDEQMINTSEQKEQLIINVANLFQRIPAKTPERLQFVTKSLMITCVPVSSIHEQFANILWKEKNYAESRYHFLHSNDESSNNCALMLIEYQVSCGYPSEVDLFITQFVLQFLCVKKTKAKVDQTFQVYTLKHPSIKNSNPPFILPLLNFLWFLLLAIDSGKSSTFKVLCDLYDTSLRRDPLYIEYLSEIGHIYFGLENSHANRINRGGFLNNLLQSLLEDDNVNGTSHDDDAPGPSSQRSNVPQSDVELD